MARTFLTRAAPANVNAPQAAVAVGDAGTNLGGTVVFDDKGNPIAVHVGPETPFYAKPLLVVGGNKFPTAVAASSLLGGVAGYLFGGPLWALGALIAGNLAGRVGAGYVCGQADKAGDAGCDQAAAWGTTA